MAITLVTAIDPRNSLSGAALNHLVGGGGAILNDVWYVIASRNVAPVMTTAGFTQIATTTSGNVLTVFRKVIVTPTTSCIVSGNGDANSAQESFAMILRGVDTTTPEDVTPTTAGALGGAPDAPAITTATDGAWVVACMTNTSADVSISSPGGVWVNFTAQSANATTNDVSQAMMTTEKATAGSIDPTAPLGWNLGDWAAITFAVRPFVAPVAAPTSLLAAFP